MLDFTDMTAEQLEAYNAFISAVTPELTRAIRNMQESGAKGYDLNVMADKTVTAFAHGLPCKGDFFWSIHPQDVLTETHTPGVFIPESVTEYLDMYGGEMYAEYLYPQGI